MFRGKRTPDDLTPIDSSDNDEQRAVKSAWNLSRYGTSWPEILKAIGLEAEQEAKNDEFVDDSLQYLLNQEADSVEYDDNVDWTRDMYLYEGLLVPSERGSYYLNFQRPWPGTERTYFNYLDSIAEHPLDNGTDKEHPINERARAYQHWKKLKYGK